MKLFEVVVNRVIDHLYEDDDFSAWFDGLDDDKRKKLMHSAMQAVRREMEPLQIVIPLNDRHF